MKNQSYSPAGTTIWTPLHLDLLIHYAVSAAPLPEPRRRAPATVEYTQHLTDEGLDASRTLFGVSYFERTLNLSYTGSGYVTTPKGRKFLERLLNTPCDGKNDAEQQTAWQMVFDALGKGGFGWAGRARNAAESAVQEIDRLQNVEKKLTEEVTRLSHIENGLAAEVTTHKKRIADLEERNARAAEFARKILERTALDRPAAQVLCMEVQDAGRAGGGGGAPASIASAYPKLMIRRCKNEIAFATCARYGRILTGPGAGDVYAPLTHPGTSPWDDCGFVKYHPAPGTFPALYRHDPTGEIVLATSLAGGEVIKAAATRSKLGYKYSDTSCCWDIAPGWVRIS